MHRRVSTGVIRLEDRELNAHSHPTLNPKYYYAALEIREVGRLSQVWYFYRWNFTLNRAEAYRV